MQVSYVESWGEFTTWGHWVGSQQCLGEYGNFILLTKGMNALELVVGTVFRQTRFSSEKAPFEIEILSKEF